MNLIFKSLVVALAYACAPNSVAAQDWNVDVFVGVVPGTDQDFGSAPWAVPAPTERGVALGIGISRSNVFTPGLELGIEYSRTYSRSVNQGFGPLDEQGAEALFVTARYNFYQTENFETYAGIGLGVVRAYFENGPCPNGCLGVSTPFINRDTVPGGQVMLGGRYRIAQNTQVFGEVRHQATFEAPITAGIPPNVNQPLTYDDITTFAVGLRFSF